MAKQVITIELETVGNHISIKTSFTPDVNEGDSAKLTFEEFALNRVAQEMADYTINGIKRKVLAV